MQNVIERSVIVCETENFSVDESWLSRQPPSTEPNWELGLIIRKAALSESEGRVFEPSGAAANWGFIDQHQIEDHVIENQQASLQLQNP
jgi:formate hydrogenlyase transcriptional activator